MTNIIFTPTVGVAPGTTTMQLGATRWFPYATTPFDLRGRGLGAIDTSARVRWDIILGIGGLAVAIAASAGLVANAIGK